MSQALWCDKGKHAFSVNDPDKQHFTQTKTVKVPTLDTYGRPMTAPRETITEELDICGPCLAKEDLFQPAGEIAAAERESDASEAEMWKAKYEAELAHNSGRSGLLSNSTIQLKPES